MPDDFRDIPEPRHDLPGRRFGYNIRITTPEGNNVHLTINVDPKERTRAREVFYSGGFKSGSQLEFQIQDDCVMISLLLQHGFRPAEIAKSLARAEQPDGSLAPASMTGLILDELIRADAELAS